MAQVPRSINSQDTANNIKLMREGIDSIAKSIEESKKTEKKDSKNLSELTKIMRSFVKEQKAQAQAKAVASQTASTPSATAAAAQTVAGTATSQGPTPAESQPPAQDTTSVPLPDILQRQTPTPQRPGPAGSQLPTPAKPSIGQRLGQIGQSLMTVGRAAAPFVGPAAAIAAPIALAAMSQRQIQEIKENPEAPGLENNPLAMQLRGEAQTVGQAGRQNRNRAVAAVYSNTIKDAVDSKMTDEELVEEFGRDRQQLREWLAKAKPGERYTPNERGAVTPTVGAPMLAANANVNASVTTFPLQQIDTQVTAADRDEAKARGMRGDTGAAIIANRRQESEKEIRQRQIGDVLEQVNTQSDIQQTPVVPQPPAPPRITTPSIEDQNFNRLRERQRLNLGPEPSFSQAEAITGAPRERMVDTPPVRPMPSRPIPGLPQRGEVIESTMTPQGRPYSGKPSTGLPGVETPAQVIPEQPQVQSAQQAQRQSSQIQFSEYKFSQADPENYEKFVEAKKKKEQEIYAEMIKSYGGEKAQPETRRTIREVARRKASTETIIQFRKEIEAAGAGSVKTEGESTVTPQRQEPTSMRVEETSTFDAGALAEKDPETHAKFVARQREIIKEKEAELEKRSDLSPMAKNVERQRIQSQAFEIAAKEFAPQAARVGAATVRSTPDVGAMTVQNQDLQRGQAQAQQAPPVIVNNNNNSSTERVISPPAQPRVESTFSRYQESRFMPAW